MLDSCMNCKYDRLLPNSEPCASCSHTNWTPVDAEPPKKSKKWQCHRLFGYDLYKHLPEIRFQAAEGVPEMSKCLVSVVRPCKDGLEVGMTLLVANHLNILNDYTIRNLCEYEEVNKKQILAIQKLDERRRKRRKATKKVWYK